jgi:pyridoxamine 5'-phosphate oxidase
MDRPLRRVDLDPDPVRQFERWFAEAQAEVDAPEAMALATASTDGVPSLRMVLLKEHGERGLAFFTHYTSRKGRELESNRRAALLFHWSPLGRQVRVEGRVQRLPEEDSDGYFATRPRGAQLGAVASRQSDPLDTRAALDDRVAELGRDFEGRDVPRPPTWGGYLVVPDAWEFWQHRESRLHDRFRYERDDSGGWRVERLFP